MIAPIVAVKHGVNDPDSLKKHRVVHVDRRLNSLANDSEIIPITINDSKRRRRPYKIGQRVISSFVS